MRVLVTGAAGKLGRAAVRALFDAGFDVRATDQRLGRDLPVSIEPANLLDRFAVYALVRDCDTVLHLGNYASMLPGVVPQQLYSENIAMNANVFLAAVEAGARQIVFASSVQVISGRDGFGDPPQPSHLPYLPLDGDLPRRPGNVYALSKVAGEQLLEHLCSNDPQLDATAVRFPTLVDPDRLHRRRRRHHGYVDSARVDEGFSYLMMSDAAALLLAIIRSPRPGYRQMFPAADDTVTGTPPAELLDQYYRDIPVRKNLNGSGGLIDNAAITDQTGWRPQLVMPREPQPDHQPSGA